MNHRIIFKKSKFDENHQLTNFINKKRNQIPKTVLCNFSPIFDCVAARWQRAAVLFVMERCAAAPCRTRPLNDTLPRPGRGPEKETSSGRIVMILSCLVFIHFYFVSFFILFLTKLVGKQRGHSLNWIKIKKNEINFIVWLAGDQSSSPGLRSVQDVRRVSGSPRSLLRMVFARKQVRNSVKSTVKSPR
jgi:hypothetical protein